MAVQLVNSVRTRDGIVCQCSEFIWMDSPVLRDLATDRSAPFNVDCDKETWFDLEVAHRERAFPTEYKDLYRLLAVAEQLQLENLIQPCLKNLFETPDYWKYQYPTEIPDAVVLLCFKEFVSCLFRTEEYYGHAVREILSLSRGFELTALVLNALNSKLEQFIELGLERVPIYFNTPCLPIVIMKRRGKPETGICYDERVRPFDLFGKNFDLSSVDIDAFHLKYAAYLLYESRGEVYYKDLRRRTAACRLLKNCKFLISRKYTVLAVTHRNSESRVWMWMENVDNGGKFTAIYSSSDEIKSVDSEPEGTILILNKNGSLLTAELDGCDFIYSKHQGEYHSAWFFEDNLYALSSKGGKSDEFHVHCFWRVGPSQWEGFSEFKGRQTLEGFAKGARVASIGGKLFRFSQRGMEIDSPNGCPELMLRPEEFVAASELHLHP